MKLRTHMYRRGDLKTSSQNKSIESISILDFPAEMWDTINAANIIMFIDDNRDVRIMKNRFGKEGTIK